jgi:hypothetical protein
MRLGRKISLNHLLIEIGKLERNLVFILVENIKSHASVGALLTERVEGAAINCNLAEFCFQHL